MTINPLEVEYLTTADVSLVPKKGRLGSSANAELEPFIYSAPMDTVTGYNMTAAMLGLGEFAVVSRFISKEERLRCWNDFATEYNAFFAIGFKDAVQMMIDIDQLDDDARVNIALDIAHGDMAQAHAVTRQLSKCPKIRSIMSGSICTPEAAARASAAGCTHIRIGVGPGAACTTRLMTGIGVPQLSAVNHIYNHMKSQDYEPILIADGGIKYPGDAVKYLAAGADAIMMGNVFSSATSSTGWLPGGNGREFKRFRGQASAEFQRDQYGQSSSCPEGKAAKNTIYRYDGPSARDIVNKYRGGLRHAISYLGLTKQSEVKPEQIQFIKITPSGYSEGNSYI